MFSSFAFPNLFFSNSKNSIPNILLLGDSISIGYTPFVKGKLIGKANVYRPVFESGEMENCQGTTNAINKLNRWLTKTGPENIHWDIIHFNFGLHDIKHVDPKTGENSNNPKDPQQADLKQYKKNLELIVQKLKTTGAQLIFATTTPYPDIVEGPVRKPGMPEKYNKVAVKIMNKYQIPVNDLYAFMLPRMDYLQIPENVHFTTDGYKALSDKVAERIIETIRDFMSKLTKQTFST